MIMNYSTKNRLRVFTSFSGYDSQCMALDRLKHNFPDFDYELVGWSEIDKYAIQAHDAIYPQYSQCNYGDIKKIDWERVPDFDLFTYSFPCTDISNAGKQMGLSRDSGTRSSLLWECEKAIEIKKPKYLLMENVSALLSDKFKPQLKKWCDVLEGYGYKSFYKILNAKQMGVPQNRAIVFMLSTLDHEHSFYFPKPFKLEKNLKDILESKVDENLYLSQERIGGLLLSNEKEQVQGNGFAFEPKTVDGTTANSVTTHAGGRKTDNFIAEPCIAAMRGRADGDWYESEHKQKLEIGSSEASNALSTVAKDNMLVEPVVLGWVRDEKGIVTSRPEVSVANCVTAGKRDNTQNYVVEQCLLNGDKDGCASTITTSHDYTGNITSPKGGHKQMGVLEMMHRDKQIPTDEIIQELRILHPNRGIMMYNSTPCFIRRLSCRELYRLMDVDNTDIDTLLSTNIPKTQHTKLAGNSICVNPLYHIFRKLFIDKEPEQDQQLTLF